MTPSTWSLIVHSLRLMGRTTVLLYPLLLLVLLLGLIRLPAEEMSALQDTWLGLGLVTVLLLTASATLAGWATMVYQAALAWCSLFFIPAADYQPRFDPKAQSAVTENPPQTSEQVAANKTQSAGLFTPLYGALALLQGFFAGIGQFFIPVTLGLGLQVALLMGMAALTDWAIAQTTGGVPLLLSQLLAWMKQHPQATQLQLNQYFETHIVGAPLQQLINVETFSLILLLGVGIYALLTTLTLLWLPLLMVWRRSILWCYWQSVRQFARDPGRLTLLMLWMALLDLGLTLLLFLSATLNNEILITITEFLWMMSLVYRLLLLTNYVLVVTGGPQLLTQSAALSTPRDPSLDAQA